VKAPEDSKELGIRFINKTFITLAYKAWKITTHFCMNTIRNCALVKYKTMFLEPGRMALNWQRM
jgi:biotin synthase-like enzyme